MKNWPTLPRLNPCVPCMVGNPRDPRLSQRHGARVCAGPLCTKMVTGKSDFCMSCSRDAVDRFGGAPPSAKCATRGCTLPVLYDDDDDGYCHKCAEKRGRKNPDRRRAKPSDLPIAKVVTTCSTKTERKPDQNPSDPEGWQIVIQPREGPAQILTDIYRLRREAKAAADSWRAKGFRARIIRGIVKRENPRLMVLNPHSAGTLIAQAEKSLRRRLTPKEHALASRAIREFKTFHGRLPESLLPVDAPPGTPLFLNYVGHEMRRDYEVKIGSERRGKWTHAAGDHGGKSRSAQAIIASIPGRKKHNTVTVEPRGARSYFKPTHGLMG